jgi:DNA/RNA-binding domain of Phe-tRNA-synthetase-like protein
MQVSMGGLASGGLPSSRLASGGLAGERRESPQSDRSTAGRTVVRRVAPHPAGPGTITAMPVFRHAPELRAAYPELVAGVLRVDGITPDADVAALAERHTATARGRLANGPESELPEIGAWRRVFARMGLKPTQYRCASEALLRRLRTDGSLPSIHPLIDLANAVSMAWAMPIAVFDEDRIAGDLVVGYAAGDERYETFGGEIEQPEPREVVFRDADGWAHARRWTNRQSGRSAIRPETARVLAVVEGVHATAGADVPRALAALADGIASTWCTQPRTAILSDAQPAFER